MSCESQNNQRANFKWSFCWCFSLNVYLGIVDGTILPIETRLPCSTRPHWLEPTIYSSEEDGLSRAASDGVGGDNLNMLSVAVKIVSDKSESNTKVRATLLNAPVVLIAGQR